MHLTYIVISLLVPMYFPKYVHKTYRGSRLCVCANLDAMLSLTLENLFLSVSVSCMHEGDGLAMWKTILWGKVLTVSVLWSAPQDLFPRIVLPQGEVLNSGGRGERVPPHSLTTALWLDGVEGTYVRMYWPQRAFKCPHLFPRTLCLCSSLR